MKTKETKEKKQKKYITSIRIHCLLRKLEKQKIMDESKFLKILQFYWYHYSTSRKIFFALSNYGVIINDKNKKTVMYNKEYTLM